MFAKIIWAFTALFVFAQADNGDFILLNDPDNVIKDSDSQNSLSDIFLNALGFTSKQKDELTNMSSPLSYPEAIVAIVVEGIDTLPSIKGKRIPLTVNELEEVTWQGLSSVIEKTDNKKNALVRMNLIDGVDALGQSALGELKTIPIANSSLKALSQNNEADEKFLAEVQLLRAIAEKVPSAVKPDEISDVYWFIVSGLRPVFEAHGQNSDAGKEAVTLLNEAIHKVNDAFREVYKKKVVVTFFTNDISQIRTKREAAADEKTNDTPANRKKATEKIYDGGWSVIFHIILWFGIIFFFSLLTICLFIADMDPGRDSIIYRMTANRIKKDN